MHKNIFKTVTAGVVFFLLSASVQAALVLDAGWNHDSVSALGLTSDSLDPVSEGYDFTLIGSALLTITDCCAIGDEFDVYNGAALLASSAPLDGQPFGDGLGEFPSIFDANFDDPNFHGVQLTLLAGSYELRIDVVSAAGGLPADFGSRLDSIAVPEPSSLALMGISLAGLGWKRRKTI